MLRCMASPLHVSIATFVEHAETLDAATLLTVAQPEFNRRKRHFFGVLRKGRFVGIASGHEISQALGSQFGHALFGRAVLQDHLMANALVVPPELPLTELVQLASIRQNADFYDDIAVVTEDRRFLGLIPMHRVVRLQTSLLLDNLAEVRSKSAELAARNRQMEDDLRMAREVQLAILPGRPHRLFHGGRSLTTSHFYEASEHIGGDFFTVLQPAPDKLGLFVCDVMGHGVRSALITTHISALVQESHGAALDPGRFLSGLNHGLRPILQSAGKLIFVTAAYALIDLSQNEVRYAQAGHPRGLLWRAADNAAAPVPIEADAEGPALGLFNDLDYAASQFAFSAGDTLLLYTDGLAEAMAADETEFGTEQIQRSFARAMTAGDPDPAAKVAGAARAHTVDGRFTDDACILVATLRDDAARSAYDSAESQSR